MFELRDYQRDWVRQVTGSLGRHRAVMGQLPTGGGKTVVAGAILAAQVKARPLAAHAWLTHRDVLRSQTAKSLLSWGLRVVDFSTMTASERQWRPGHVHIVSTGLRSLPDWTSDGLTDGAEAGLLVVDEAHHATAAKSWAPKISTWPGKALGITATPWRLSKKQGFEHLFDDLVLGPDVSALTASGALAKAMVMYPQDWHFDRDRLDRNSMGEVSASSAAAEQDRLLHITSAAQWHTDSCLKAGVDPTGARTIWFCSTVAAATQLADHLVERGQKAETISADTPSKERRRIVNDLALGTLQHVTNCEVLTEGLDVPAVDVAVMLRPTESLALHLQMCGRALRPPGPVLILDAAGNSLAHGLPTEPHRWSLRARDLSPPSDQGEPWTVQCVWDGCGRLLHSANRMCDSCQRPQQKPCVGCARWRRLNKYPQMILEPAQCVECEEGLAAFHYSGDMMKAADLRTVLVQKLSDGVAMGAWSLSWLGNPHVKQVDEEGTTWTVVARNGMVLRKSPGSEEFEKVGPLTRQMIQQV